MDLRRAVAHFQHGLLDGAAAQLLDMELHDRLSLCWNALVPTGPVFRELIFQGHGMLLKSAFLSRYRRASYPGDAFLASLQRAGPRPVEQGEGRPGHTLK